MERPRPNLLFIMTDQQRFDTLGVNGRAGANTPTLDALAQSGANLTRYFTNAPVCVPSRACLFTGRYPHSHAARENYAVLEAGREFHLFRVLKQEGYRLGYCGKNHLVDDLEKPNFDVFDERGSERPSPEERVLMERYWKWRSGEGALPPGRSEIWRGGMVHDGPPEATRAWQTAQAGVEFLKGSGQGGDPRPFALCVSFEDPHVPHLALREYFEMHRPEQISLPEFGGEEELAQKASRWLIKYGAMNTAAASDAQKRRYLAIYRAMISWIDRQVGRLLATLGETGRAEDTLVVFTSDHGDFAFHHGLAKKDLVLVDDLLHVPCILSWPGRIPEGRTVTALAEEVDLMPTILDLLGVEAPVGVQGESFARAVLGGVDAHKEAVFAEVCPPYLFNKYVDFEAFASENGGRGNTPFNVPGDFTKSIREADLRYIWYGNGEEELYDYREDPEERTNLARDPRWAQEKARLKMRLLEWHALTEDPLDPNLRRDLQKRYPVWNPLSVQPGKHEQPRWKETIHLRMRKSV